MASNPPSQCCVAGFRHEGETTGKFITIDDINTYVSGDSSSKKVLLFLTDVFGPEYINSKLMADSFAKNGYYVLVPDLFEGGAMKPGDTFHPSFLEAHSLERVEPIVLKTLSYIRKQVNPEFICSLGHCFGAKYVVRLLDGRIDVGAIAHPSFVEMEEIERITKPLLIAAAEEDQIFTDDGRYKTELTLKKMKATYFITLISNTVHGFAVRGDPNDKWGCIAKEKVFTDTVWWYSLFQ